MGAPDVLSDQQTARYLQELGFPVRTTAQVKASLTNFQNGWNLGHWLPVNGTIDRATSAALRISIANLRSGKSTASPHFSYAEFTCKAFFPDCAHMVVDRDLLRALEAYRTAVGGPISIISGYRCPTHNKDVGGKPLSKHLDGSAADVLYFPGFTATKVKGLKLFSGIGKSRSTQLVRHVDVRHASSKNTTNSSVTNPAIWDYAT